MSSFTDYSLRVNRPCRSFHSEEGLPLTITGYDLARALVTKCQRSVLGSCVPDYLYSHLLLYKSSMSGARCPHGFEPHLPSSRQALSPRKLKGGVVSMLVSSVTLPLTTTFNSECSTEQRQVCVLSPFVMAAGNQPKATNIRITCSLRISKSKKKKFPPTSTSHAPSSTGP